MEQKTVVQNQSKKAGVIHPQPSTCLSDCHLQRLGNSPPPRADQHTPRLSSDTPHPCTHGSLQALIRFHCERMRGGKKINATLVLIRKLEKSAQWDKPYQRITVNICQTEKKTNKRKDLPQIKPLKKGAQ